MGILAGLGAGLSLGIICITPQHWLDKTRERYNPYLFIGAPIFVTITASLGMLSILFVYKNLALNLGLKQISFSERRTFLDVMIN